MAILGVGTVAAACRQAVIDGTELVEALGEVTCKRCWRKLKNAYPISTGVIENKRAAAIIAALNQPRRST